MEKIVFCNTYMRIIFLQLLVQITRVVYWVVIQPLLDVVQTERHRLMEFCQKDAASLKHLVVVLITSFQLEVLNSKGAAVNGLLTVAVQTIRQQLEGIIMRDVVANIHQMVAVQIGKY